MKTVTIYPPVEVFGDPEFCNNQTKSCVRLFRGQCEQFFVNLSHTFPLTGENDKYKKCQQCKELYRSARMNELGITEQDIHDTIPEGP